MQDCLEFVEVEISRKVKAILVGAFTDLSLSDFEATLSLSRLSHNIFMLNLLVPS